MSSGSPPSSDTKVKHEPKREEPEDYYSYDELDFEPSPTIISRGDISNRIERMRNVIQDEDLDRSLLNAVDDAEEDLSKGGSQILWIDLFIGLYRLTPYLLYGALLVDSWDELYNEYLPIMSEAMRVGSVDARTYAEVLSFILGKNALVPESDRPGIWAGDFINIMDGIETDNLLSYSAQPTLRQICIFKYNTSDKDLADLQEFGQDGTHFQDPTDLGVGYTLNSIITGWYHEGTDRFRQLRQHMGVTESAVLGMGMSELNDLLGSEIWNLPYFPSEDLLKSAFQSNPGMILEGREFLLEASFYEVLDDHNLSISEWWDQGRAFPIGEWEGNTELTSFNLASDTIVCAVLWDVIQNGTYASMLDDKGGM